MMFCPKCIVRCLAPTDARDLRRGHGGYCIPRTLPKLLGRKDRSPAWGVGTSRVHPTPATAGRSESGQAWQGSRQSPGPCVVCLPSKDRGSV